jgi:hypothetical protein
MIADQTLRPRVLRPAVTAAAISSCLVALGFGFGAFAWGVMGFAQRGEPVIGLMFSPFVGAGLAVICGFLGLLPALAWIASALFMGPRIWLSRAGRFRGVLMGLACSAPTFLVGHWISQADPFGANFPIGPIMDIAVIFAGILAGLIMIRLMRNEARQAAA